MEKTRRAPRPNPLPSIHDQQGHTQITEIWTLENALGFVAYHTGQRTGALFVDRIQVVPHLRGRRIGQHALTYVAQGQPSALHVKCSNGAARKMYERIGYTTHEDGEYPLAGTRTRGNPTYMAMRSPCVTPHDAVAARPYRFIEVRGSGYIPKTAWSWMCTAIMRNDNVGLAWAEKILTGDGNGNSMTYTLIIADITRR